MNTTLGTSHKMRARTHTRTGIDKSTAVCDTKDTVYAPMYSNYKVYVLWYCSVDRLVTCDMTTLTAELPKQVATVVEL